MHFLLHFSVSFTTLFPILCPFLTELVKGSALNPELSGSRAISGGIMLGSIVEKPIAYENTPCGLEGYETMY